MAASFESLFRGSGSWDVKALLKANDISSSVQAHLKNVYATLAFGVAMTAVGVWVQLNFLHLPYWVAGLGTVGMMMWCAASRDASLNKRLAIFAGFAALKGATLGDLVDVILAVDPRIILSTLLYTVAAFACFSGFALFSKRRSQLYLGGILASVVSWFFIGSMLNLFLRSPLIFNVQLYGGLLLFIGYVVVDTQMIIERASAGASDFINDAMALYVDFVAIAVRVAIILLKNSQKKSESRDKRSNRR